MFWKWRKRARAYFFTFPSMESTLLQLCADLLDCDTLDAAYIVRLLDTYDLRLSELLEGKTEAGRPRGSEANRVIDLIFSRIAEDFLASLPSRIRLHAITFDYSTYINCLDSQIWFEDESLEERFQRWRKD